MKRSEIRDDPVMTSATVLSHAIQNRRTFPDAIGGLSERAMPATARLQIGVSVCRIATCLSRAWPAPTQEIEPVGLPASAQPT